MTTGDIALRLNARLIGSNAITIGSISAIDDPKDNSIVFVEKQSLLAKALESPAKAILLSDLITVPLTDKCLIISDKPRVSWIKLLHYFSNDPIVTAKPGSNSIHETAIIGSGVQLGQNVSIMAYCVIGDNVSIADAVTLYPHCSIQSGSAIGKESTMYNGVFISSNSIIGENNILYSGVVIGSDGFGYHDENGKRYKVPHLGYVETGVHVEIGANTCIDKSVIGRTYIGSHTKIDNLVQIAHNCKIGDYCYIAAQTGIAGSVNIGNNVSIAGQVGIRDHVSIGDNVVIMAQSGVTKSIPSGETVMGFPAKPIGQARKTLALINRLPQLFKRINNN